MSFDVPNPIPTETNEQIIEKAKEKIQIFLNNYSYLFTHFAEDTSLTFIVGTSFRIFTDTGKIEIPISWFTEKGYSEMQILWACFHELAHFRELVDDPEGVKAGYEFTWQQAEKTAQKMQQRMIEIYGDERKDEIEALATKKPTNTGKNEQRNISKLDKEAYEIHHRFMNIFRDIFVNNYVSRRAPLFQAGGVGAEEVYNLYEKKLFSIIDYSSTPDFQQFTDVCLRGEMVPDKEMIISAGVGKALEREITFEGKTYSVREIIDTFLKPLRDRDTSSTRRLEVLKATLYPIFQDLLDEYLKTWTPDLPDKKDDKKSSDPSQAQQSNQPHAEKENAGTPPPSEGSEAGVDQGTNKDGKGDALNPDSQKPQNDNKPSAGNDQPDGTPSSAEHGGKNSTPIQIPFAETNSKSEQDLPHIDEGDIQDFLNRRRKNVATPQPKPESQKPKQPTLDELQAVADREFATRHSINQTTMTRFRTMMNKTERYYNELSRLWDSIIRGKSSQVERTTVFNQTNGDVSIPHVIAHWPAIHKPNPPIYSRHREVIREQSEKPEEVRIRLVCDVSSSMGNVMSDFTSGFFPRPTRKKIETMQELCVLLLSSLDNFDKRLRKAKTTRTEIKTQVMTFANTTSIIKPLTSQSPIQNEISIIKSFEMLEKIGGGTRNAIPLEMILQSLTEEDKKRIKEGRLRDLVIVITDGVPQDDTETIQKCLDLEKLGFTVIAFQVGASQSDIDTFNRVWNNDGNNDGKGRGVVVKGDVSQLVPTVVNALQAYLKKIVY